ncbi:MAG: hydantoinase B/oxoprolinase family protein, partial [Chloroflexi bacterium]|nr:hydantoinase B/oxoprolinase family protein [Chloroflexota bacterium]
VSIPPWGVGGGKPGMGNRFLLNPDTPREKLVSKTDGEPIRAGDRMRIETPGGGGWGDPLEREPEAVQLDVIRGLVSPESARKEYGVILRPEGWEISREESRRLREEMRQARGGLKVIDRGENFEQLLREGRVSLTTSDAG